MFRSGCLGHPLVMSRLISRLWWRHSEVYGFWGWRSPIDAAVTRAGGRGR